MRLKIYILKSGVAYEGEDILRAFRNKEEAEAFAEECRKWINAEHSHESGYFAFCHQFCESKYIGEYVTVEEVDLAD